MTNVVVVGAGPAGLTAAYELAKLGPWATVLEADDQVGGLSRTVNYRGYRFDIGGHRFFSKVPIVNELWHEILGEELLVRPRLSRIYYRERFFDYPLKATNAFANLGPLEAALILASYARAKLLPHQEEHNFEQWVSNRFGYRLYRTFFKTYTEKVWGIPCAEISADWAAQRIKNLSLREALLNAFLGSESSKDGQIITTLIDRFYYPRLGPGMMWERCEALLEDQGYHTYRGIRVERLRHRSGRVEGVCGRSQTGETVECGAEHVISTMPLRELVFALDPPPPAEVLQAAQHLRYRDYLTVVLMVNRESVFPDNWIYIHAPEVRMGRIQNYKNWSAAMVPEASRTSLGLEYFLWETDPVWHWSDQQLVELGRRECTRLGLIDPRDVDEGTVVRMRKAYPVYDQHYHASIAIIRAYLDNFVNLQTVGRNGLHRYNNQDHAMLTGIYAARNVVGERHDVWAVNTEQAYHEDGQVAADTHAERLVPVRVVPEAAASSQASDDVIAAAVAPLDPLALGVAIGTVSGLGLFLAVAVLLLHGELAAKQTLALVGQYLPRFEVSWAGACIGLVEATCGGFLLGSLGAWLRNRGMTLYVSHLQRRAEAEVRRRLLDEV